MNDSDLDNVAPIPNYGHKKEADYRKWSGFSLTIQCECLQRIPETSKKCKYCGRVNPEYIENHFGKVKRQE